VNILTCQRKAGRRPNWPGFDPAVTQVPVALWHGLRDTAAPPGHSRWLADHIPHATAHFPADQDHTNVEENNRGAAIAWARSHM
jgi:pimeloyl-ACP methyl ester carboxylesterase